MACRITLRWSRGSRDFSRLSMSLTPVMMMALFAGMTAPMIDPAKGRGPIEAPET